MAEHILVEAKKVSTDAIIDILCPHIYNGLKNMYKQASELNKNESIKMFQISLSRIPVLPANILKSDYTYLLNENGCDESKLTKLIESLFICHAKLNLIAQGLDFNTKINLEDLEIPSNMNFVHQCYIGASREIYTSANLFSHKYNAEQQAQNREFINQKIVKGIIKTVRDLIPLNTLYNKYITQSIVQKGGQEDNKQKNNLEALMNFKIDTSFVNDMSSKANIKAQKLSSENLSRLQKNIANKDAQNNSSNKPIIDITANQDAMQFENMNLSSEGEAKQKPSIEKQIQDITATKQTPSLIKATNKPTNSSKKQSSTESQPNTSALPPIMIKDSAVTEPQIPILPKISVANLHKKPSELKLTAENISNDKITTTKSSISDKNRHKSNISAEQKIAEQKIVEPKVNETKITETKIAEPKVAEQKVNKTEVEEPKVAEQKISETEVEEQTAEEETSDEIKLSNKIQLKNKPIIKLKINTDEIKHIPLPPEKESEPEFMNIAIVAEEKFKKGKKSANASVNNDSQFNIIMDDDDDASHNQSQQSSQHENDEENLGQDEENLGQDEENLGQDEENLKHGEEIDEIVVDKNESDVNEIGENEIGENEIDENEIDEIEEEEIEEDEIDETDEGEIDDTDEEENHQYEIDDSEEEDISHPLTGDQKNSQSDETQPEKEIESTKNVITEDEIDDNIIDENEVEEDENEDEDDEIEEDETDKSEIDENMYEVDDSDSEPPRPPSESNNASSLKKVNQDSQNLLKDIPMKTTINDKMDINELLNATKIETTHKNDNNDQVEISKQDREKGNNNDQEDDDNDQEEISDQDDETGSIETEHDKKFYEIDDSDNETQLEAEPSVMINTIDQTPQRLHKNYLLNDDESLTEVSEIHSSRLGENPKLTTQSVLTEEENQSYNEFQRYINAHGGGKKEIANNTLTVNPSAINLLMDKLNKTRIDNQKKYFEPTKPENSSAKSQTPMAKSKNLPIKSSDIQQKSSDVQHKSPDVPQKSLDIQQKPSAKTTRSQLADLMSSYYNQK